MRSAAPTEEERAPSVAASELGQLRQRHPVSALRCGNILFISALWYCLSILEVDILNGNDCMPFEEHADLN